ncbi:MAG: hypothetical protein QF464_22135, partial [Myxococcota bacterium]|nr:hypothetical protein [Myxococcota bacterium]
VFICGSCGGPMDAPWHDLVIVCSFCGCQNFPGRPDAPVPPRIPVDGRPRFSLGGRSYVIEGHLADGDSTSVYRGRWVVRLGELVVVKVQRTATDADLLRREWNTLRALRQSQVQGVEHFVTRLPTPIAHGLVETNRPRVTSIFGWKSGFVHTLTEAGEVHDDGIDGKVIVWILKRILELLGFVHRAGFVHGAVVPDHVLLHPRDHGANLIGWTLSTPWSSGKTRPLPGRSAAWAQLYPQTDEATPRLDLQLACRCAQAAGGWLGKKRSLLHPGLNPLLQLLERGATGSYDDAWALRDALVEASGQSFGPPGYNPLPMPGWRP